jgi:hypothetical protein
MIDTVEAGRLRRRVKKLKARVNALALANAAILKRLDGIDRILYVPDDVRAKLFEAAREMKQ